MSFSRGGRTETVTQQTTEQINAPTNLQDTEGVAIGSAGGNVTITSTDGGAFATAADLVRDAADLARDVTADSITAQVDTTLASNDLARDVTSGALNFGRTAIGEVADAGRRAIGEVADAYDDATAQAYAFAGDTRNQAFSYFDRVNSEALDFVRETTSSVYDRALGQVGDTVEAINKIAVDSKKSTDSRVAEISNNAIKYGSIALGVIGVAVLAFALMRK